MGQSSLCALLAALGVLSVCAALYCDRDGQIHRSLAALVTLLTRATRGKRGPLPGRRPPGCGTPPRKKPKTGAEKRRPKRPPRGKK
jgi:hypothetical protein